MRTYQYFNCPPDFANETPLSIPAHVLLLRISGWQKGSKSSISQSMRTFIASSKMHDECLGTCLKLSNSYGVWLPERYLLCLNEENPFQTTSFSGLLRCEPLSNFMFNCTSHPGGVEPATRYDALFSYVFNAIFLILIAALISLSWCEPHSGQVHSRMLKFFTFRF